MAIRLKLLREEKGLSHERLSALLQEKYGVKISKDSLMNYEVSDQYHVKAGKNQGMRVEYLRCLADFYGVSSDYLLGITTVRSSNPGMRQAVEFTGLSEEAIKAIKSSQRGIGGTRQNEFTKILNWLLAKPAFVFSIISTMNSLKNFSTLYQKITSELDGQFSNAYKEFSNGEQITHEDTPTQNWAKMEQEVSDNISLARFQLSRSFDSTIDEFVKEFCSPAPDDYHRKMMEALSNGND